MLQRIVRGRSATLTHTFRSGGVATNPSPDAATVTITASDGTVLANAANATEAGTGVVTYTVTPAQTAQLDSWTVVWTATFGGQSQTFKEIIQVVGDVLFSIADARSVPVLSDSARYPEESLNRARTLVEDALEKRCGVAFVQRYARESVSGSGGSDQLLKWPKVTAVRSANIGGADVTPLSNVVALVTGAAYYATGWATGYGNVTIGYEHGYGVLMDPTPPEAYDVALTLARNRLVAGPIDDRTTSMSNEAGTFSLSTPGRGGSAFGVPVVDEFIQAYNLYAGVA